MAFFVVMCRFSLSIFTIKYHKVVRNAVQDINGAPKRTMKGGPPTNCR